MDTPSYVTRMYSGDDAITTHGPIHGVDEGERPVAVGVW